MFTVVLLRSRVKPMFAQSRALFEPFEEGKLVAFAEWNESPRARSLADAIPDLRKLIKGKREWRVVVVDHAVDEGPDASQPDNPFDYLDNESGSASQLALEESPHRLIQLTHMLLGFPPIGTKGFEAVYSYHDPSRPDDGRVEVRASELAEPGEPPPPPSVVRTRLAGIHDLKVHYEEIPHTPQERERYEQVRALYEFRGNRPAEVILVSTRRPPEADPHAQLRAAWSTDLGRVPSRFADRNGYPAGTRFAVYDLIDPEHSDYEQHVLRFWLSVLSVAVNDMPPSAFHGDGVYSLGTEVDTETLIGTLNAHLSRLGTVRDRIDAVFRNPVRRPRSDLTTLVVEQEIPVEFEHLGTEPVAAAVDGYSLATDVPFNETSRWWSEYGEIVKRVEALLRKPRRVLAAAVYDARLRARLVPAEEIELSQFEREDLEDDLTRQVRALAAPATAQLLDRKATRRMLERHHRQILQTMSTRLDSTTILVATGVALGGWTIGLLPYLVQAGTMGGTVLTDALLVSALALVILLAGGVAALLVQRARLLGRIRDLNRDLQAMRGQVHGGAATFGRYLTDLSTYMRARALVRGSVIREAQERERLQQLQHIRLRIARAMEFERSLVVSLGGNPVVQRLEDGDLHTFDLGNWTRVRRLLQLPSPAGLMIPFNESGEQIRAPYDFVAKLILRRIPLFEHTDETDSGAPAPDGTGEDVPA